MPSTVYFIDLRAAYEDSFINKLGKLKESTAGKRQIQSVVP